MTNEKREALIEEHRGVIAAFGETSLIGNLARRTIRALEAVFEQVHTDTDDELKALLADAAAYTDGYTEEDASGPIKIIIRLVTALRHPVQAEEAHTPTDDERERIEQSNDIAYTVIEVAQNKAPEEFVTLDFRYGIADALWDAGYRKARRTVQAHTPTDDEREATAKAIRLSLRFELGWSADEARTLGAVLAEPVATRLATLRRTAVQEPSADEDEFAPGECTGAGDCDAPIHVHGCYRPHRADQCDSPDEYGHIEPQSEPTDAERGIEEALAWIGRAWDDGNASGLDGWVGPGRGAGEVDHEAQHARTRMVHQAEAALRAAFQTGENRE